MFNSTKYRTQALICFSLLIVFSACTLRNLSDGIKEQEALIHAQQFMLTSGLAYD